MAEQILIEYIAQVEGLKAQLKTVQTELKSVQTKADDSAKATTASFKGAGDSIKGIAGGIAASLAAAFTVGAVINFAKESIKAFQESEAVAKKLEFAITRIGNEGAAAFEKLTKQADRFAKISIFDDESIRKSQTQLAQYGLQSDAIEKLIPQIIDLASATGQDLGSATDLIIQGINGQGRALKQYGIILEDTGSKTKNLSIVTDGLSKFAGAAADELETAAGKAKLAENNLNELQETVGERLIPFFNKLKEASISAQEAFADLITEFDPLNSAIEKNKKTVDGFVETYSKLSDDKLLRQYVFVNKEINQLLKEQERILKSGVGDEDAINNRIAATRRERIAIEQVFEARKKTAKDDLGLTAKGIADAEAAEKKKTEDFLKEKDRQRKITEEYELDMLKLKLEKDKEKEKSEKETTDQMQKELDARFAANTEYFEKRDEQEDEDAKKRQKQREEIERAAFDFVVESGNAIFDYRNQVAQMEADREIERLTSTADFRKMVIQDQVDAGVLSERDGASAILEIDRELDTKKKEAARQQAVRDKSQAAFNIVLHTAEGVVAALAALNPILAAIIGATGAVELAAVIARPIPFAKGVIDLQGGRKGKDSIPAMLMPGESVMTTDETTRHKDLLQSIRNDNLDKYLLENYVNPKVNKVLKEYSFAENVNQSLKLNSKFPDEYALGRVMRRNNQVKLGNADYLANRIATEIAGKLNNANKAWS